MKSLYAQIRKLHEEVRFLEVPSLATNTLLGTTVISRYVEKISPQAYTIGPVNSKPVTFVEAAMETPAKPAEIAEYPEPANVPCVMAPAVKLSPIKERFVESKRRSLEKIL